MIGHGKTIEVDHMRGNVNTGADDDGPRSGLVKGDILVEGNDIVKGRAAQEGDEIAADGEEDEYHINMQNKCGATGDGCIVERLQ